MASLDPRYGYGTDISGQMIIISRLKYKDSKNLQFSTVWPKEKFDYIFMSDVIEHLEKPEETFRKISGLMDNGTILICTMANPIWEPLMIVWEKLGWKMKEGPHKRVAFNDLKLMIETTLRDKNSKLRLVKHDFGLLIPVKIPVITDFANKYLEKYFKNLAFIEYFVAVKS